MFGLSRRLGVGLWRASDSKRSQLGWQAVAVRRSAPRDPSADRRARASISISSVPGAGGSLRSWDALKSGRMVLSTDGTIRFCSLWSVQTEFTVQGVLPHDKETLPFCYTQLFPLPGPMEQFGWPTLACNRSWFHRTKNPILPLHFLMWWEWIYIWGRASLDLNTSCPAVHWPIVLTTHWCCQFLLLSASFFLICKREIIPNLIKRWWTIWE